MRVEENTFEKALAYGSVYRSNCPGRGFASSSSIWSSESLRAGRTPAVERRVDSETLRILERSCQNCHSQNTDWPWFSYVAPVSWLIESDVHKARNHMNLSRWSQYSLEEKQELLAEMGSAVRSRQMPPSRYTVMHGSAKLSESEREQIYQWARGERHRLKALATEGAPSADKAATQ